MSDLKHLDELNRLPRSYYEGREDAALGIQFRPRVGESQVDADARYIGHFDIASCITPLERARKEEEETR